MGYELTVEHVPDRTIPDETILTATVEDIKIHEFSWTDRNGDKQDSAIFQWWFTVTDHASDDLYHGRKILGETDARISDHPRNKLRAWAETLLSRSLVEGARFNTDELIGLPAKIYVKHKADKKDTSKSYERVDDLLPAGRASLSESPPF